MEYQELEQRFARLEKIVEGLYLISCGIKCCTGINGSHNARCEQRIGDTQTCWCCRKEFPVDETCLWCWKGSRCFDCEYHDYDKTCK